MEELGKKNPQPPFNGKTKSWDKNMLMTKVNILFQTFGAIGLVSGVPH